MSLLLDTHVLLWWLDDHPALSRKPRAAIADGKNLVFISAIKDLPAHHRDPFDRMLVAQTKVEHLTLVTRDIRLKKYKIPLIKA